MKLRAATIFHLLFFSMFLYGQNRGYVKPEIYAVVIGITDYKDVNIPDLHFPEKDATAFYNFLRSSNAGAIPEEHIAFLTGPKATTSNILRAVVDKFSRSNKEDMIIFYFSGHGKAGFNGRGFLLSYDADFENEIGTAISMPYLKETIDGFNAKMKIAYVDACHAGLFSTDGKGIKEDENAIIARSYLEVLNKSGKGSVRFLASSVQQESREDPKLAHGVFTYYLIKGLQGEADLSQPETENYNDGVVTISELNTYITGNISKHTRYKQSPSVEGNYNDLFPLSILKPGISLANIISKTISYEETKPVNQNKLNELPGQTDPNLKKSKNPNCLEERTGDYCFQNNTESDIEVSLFPSQRKIPGPGTAYLFTLLQGQRQCFYNVPEGPARFSIKSVAMFRNGSGPAPKEYFLDGSVYVDACLEGTYVIKK